MGRTSRGSSERNTGDGRNGGGANLTGGRRSWRESWRGRGNGRYVRTGSVVGELPPKIELPKYVKGHGNERRSFIEGLKER